MLVSGGQGRNAFLWDVPQEGLGKIQLKQGLPHCKESNPAATQGIETDITCIHWNPTGDRFVTSASDGYARIWSD